MRLLFFTAHFHPYKGGLENFVLELTTRLAKKGIKIDILTFNTENRPYFEKYKGLNIYRLPYKYMLKKVYALPKKNKKFFEVMGQVEKNKYDYVITQTRFFYTSYMGMKYAKKRNIKLIHIEHGTSHVKHPNKLIQLASFLYDLTIGKQIFRNAWKVIGISKASCKFSKKMGAKNVSLMYNSIDVSKFKNIKTNLRKTLKISNDKIITFIGRLIYSKGVQDLIKATENMKNVKVLIVGDGPHKNELIKLVEDRKDILFLGEKNEKEIIEILSITDIFVNPSYSEGLPTSILEAGAIGIPIVATDVGGTKEIITNDYNGFLVSPKNTNQMKDSVNKLLKNNNIKKQFSANLKRKVKEKFEWNKNINLFKKLIRK